MSERRDFDVCVVGTGAGGGVMIDALARAGFEVVGLQRGPHLDASQLVDDELSTIVREELFADGAVETYRGDEGETAVAGRFSPAGNCVGGMMLRWAGWSWRFRPDDFRLLSAEGAVAGASLADWPISYDELAPWYAVAERDFGVAGAAGANPFEAPREGPYPNPPHPDRRASRLFDAGARALGYHPFPLPVAINPRGFAGRSACTYGGACQGFGCRIHAKATTFSVSLPRALATGRVRLVPQAMVFELAAGEDGRVRAARYLDASGAQREIRARHFVVSCNAIGSARLLLLSRSGSFPRGLANSSGLVGRNLMLHHHAALRLLTAEPALGFTGFEAHRAFDDFHPSDPRRGFIRGGVVAEVNAFTRQPITYALASAGAPGLSRAWGAPMKRFLRDFPRAVTIGSVLEDLPMESNRVDLDPQVTDRYGLAAPRITHRQHANDIAMNRWVAARLPELADACGAVEKWPIRMPGLTYVDEQSAMKGSAHLHGTCRMGTDPARSVLDRWCRAHDVPNLWVVDGSCFPSSGGYNPTLTILANAYRVADHFIREAKRQSL